MNASARFLPLLDLSLARSGGSLAMLVLVLLFASGSRVTAEQATIHGFVTGHDQQGENPEALAGAKVEFLAEGGNVVASATTDENGMYRIDDLNAQQYGYRVTADDYLEQKVPSGFEFQASESAHVLNFILTKRDDSPQPLGTLRGTVLGVKHGRPRPLEAATVYLKHAESDELKQLVTDENGRYQIDLVPGAWQRVASATGYPRDIHPSAIQVTAGEGQTHNIELLAANVDSPGSSGTPPASQESLSIHGRIFGQDETGQELGLIAAATITSSGGSSASATTDENGYFLIESVVPGELTYRVTAADYLSQTTRIQLDATAGVHVLDVILTKGTETDLSQLAGSVVEEGDDERRPITQAVVKLDHLDFPSSLDLPVGGASAEYFGEDMEPGRWRATVTAPGFKPYAHKAVIDLQAGEQKEQDFVLERVDPTAGRDSTHTAMVSVEISEKNSELPTVQFVNVATGEATEAELQTDSDEVDVLDDGNTKWLVYVAYPKTALSAGEYQAVARLGETYEDDTDGPQQVDPGESAIFNLTLRVGEKPVRPALLAGLVVEEVGGERKPITDAVVNLRHVEEPVSHNLSVDKAAGRRGRFVGADLAPGEWQATVSAPGFKPYVHESPIALQSGQQKRQDFILQRGARKSSTTAVVSVENDGETQGKPQVSFVNIKGGARVQGIVDDASVDSLGTWDVLVYYPKSELPAGEYRTEATLVDHRGDTSDPQAISTDSSTVFNLTLRLAPPEPAMIAGGVYEGVDGERKFISDAVVKLVHVDSPASLDLPVKSAGKDVFFYRSQPMTPGLWRASVSASSEFEPYVHPEDLLLKPGEQRRQDFVLKRRAPGRTASTIAMVSIVDLPNGSQGVPQVQFVHVDSGLAIEGRLADDGGDLLSGEESDWRVLVYSPARTLPPGQYRAVARQQGYMDDANGPKKVGREGSTLFDLILRPLPVPQHGGLWVTVSCQYGDEEPEPIPGAIVNLLNVETGQRRQLVTKESGECYGHRLPAGKWQVSARIAGMPAEVQRNLVTVVAGRDAESDIQLKVEPPELFVIVGVPQLSGEPGEVLIAPVGGDVPQAQFVDEQSRLFPADMQLIDAEWLTSAGINQTDLPEGAFRWFGGHCPEVVDPGKFYAVARMTGFQDGFSASREVDIEERSAFIILLRSQPAARLLVKVEDQDRQPLADAALQVQDSEGNPVNLAWSNEAGGFVSAPLTPGQFTALATVEGWELLEVSHQNGRVTVQNGQLSTVTFTFRRPPPPRLLVKVVRELPTEAGRAIKQEEVSDAVVKLKPTNFPNWTAPWDEPLQPLQAGLYSLELDEPPTHSRWDYSVEMSEHPGEPELGQVASKRDGGAMLIILRPPPSPAPLLVRVVRVDEVDIAKPLSGATVFLKPPGEDRPIKLSPVEGAEQGLYELALDAPLAKADWEYAVKASEADEFIQGQVNISPGQIAEIKIKSQSPVPDQPTGLLVHVWKNKNREQLQVPFLVKIENQTEGKRFRLRNMKRKGESRNEFEEVLEPGNYQVTVTVPGLKTWNEEIVLKKGRQLKLDFYLEPPTFEKIEIAPTSDKVGSVSGRVLMRNDGGALEPIGNATVYLKKGEAGELNQLITNEKGEFTANAIDEGEWRLVAKADGVRSPIHEIAVEAGRRAERDIVVAAPARPREGSLSAIVLSPDDKPLAGAIVLLKRREGDNWTRRETDADGKYETESLEPGQWQIKAEFAGSTSEIEQVTIAAGDRALHALIVQPEVEPIAPAEKVKVPDVENLALDDARAAFNEAGLASEVPNTLARGQDRVVRQSIRAGRLVDRGTEIRLDPVIAQVPDVTGLTIEAAIQRLKGEHDFDANYSRAVTGQTIVTRQLPAAGSALSRGRPVALICTVRVPNVQGRGVKEGADLIFEAGLEADFSMPADATNFVFAQNPRAGSTVDVGSQVLLVPGVRAPNLINLSYNAAERTLLSLSVRGQVERVITQNVAVTEAGANMREPWIISQRPQAGAPMAKSDVVRVIVGQLQGVVVENEPIGGRPAEASCPECGKPHSQCQCNIGGGGFGGG